MAESATKQQVEVVNAGTPIEVTVDGSATEAKQDVGNTALAEIAADLPQLGLGPQDATASLAAVLPNTLDAGNTNLATLDAGETWPGIARDTTGYSYVLTSFKADQVGEFTQEFSSDGATWDSVIGPYPLTAGTNSPQPLVPSRRYYRATFHNTSGVTANLRVETRLLSTPGLLLNRVQDSVTNLSTSATVRSVNFGFTEGGGVYRRGSMSPEGHLEVSLVAPRTAFGDVAVAEDSPVIQVQNFQYGVNDRLVEAYTSGSGVVGTGTGTERTLLTVSTGTTTGSVADASSRMRINYRAGQGIEVAMTHRFTTPVANTTQYAGLFDACDGIGFGCDGTSFGILHRSHGQRELRTLTVTAAATGAETATVTLNGVAKVVSLTDASGNKVVTANEIARADYSATGGGWQAYVLVPTGGGNPVVYFLAKPAGSLSGAYSLASTGAAAGTFASSNGGVTPTNTWIPQASWNVDKCDGSSTPSAPNANNPSGASIAVTNVQVIRMQLQYLGNGNILLWVENKVNGQFTPVHIIERAGEFTTTSFGNLSLPMAIHAENGSTTSDVKVATGSMYAAVEGRRVLSGPSVGSYGTRSAIGATPLPVLTIRNDLTYGSQPNHCDVVLPRIDFVNKNGNQMVVWTVLRNATLSTDAAFSRLSPTAPISQDTTATSVTGGSVIFTVPQVADVGTERTFDPENTDLGRLFPGDSFTFAASTSGSAIVGAVGAMTRWTV